MSMDKQQAIDEAFVLAFSATLYDDVGLTPEKARELFQRVWTGLNRVASDTAYARVREIENDARLEAELARRD